MIPIQRRKFEIPYKRFDIPICVLEIMTMETTFDDGRGNMKLSIRNILVKWKI